MNVCIYNMNANYKKTGVIIITYNQVTLGPELMCHQ